MKKSCIQIKPSNLSLSDFISPESSVKPAVEYEGESWVFCLSNDPFAFVRLQPVPTSDGRRFWDIKFLVETRPDQFEIFEIAYKSLNGPRVSVNGIPTYPCPAP